MHCSSTSSVYHCSIDSRIQVLFLVCQQRPRLLSRSRAFALRLRVSLSVSCLRSLSWELLGARLQPSNPRGGCERGASATALRYATLWQCAARAELRLKRAAAHPAVNLLQIPIIQARWKRGWIRGNYLQNVLQMHSAFLCVSTENRMACGP